MYIPEEKISEILNTSDIVDVISESVILKKSGRNYFGLCPFHSEKTPSFSVNPAKQIFHCFGCSAGGNVLTYVMKYHGLTFPEAVRMMARKYQVTIETREMDPAKKAQMDLKERLHRLNSKVMDAYGSWLKNEHLGRDALNYLKKRGTSDDIVTKFHIGFSPDSWDSVVKFFRQHKTTRKTALQSGLVMERQQSSGFYDRFRNRIMFPIFDINMQVAGFGGRVMDDAMPKYMNSPETPVYSKSRILYGLHASKSHCRREGCVYIVEGYFDFLSLYQHGVKNVVATLGTALTSEHVRILKGYAAKMILVFDSDAAGINAAKRSIQTFVKEGIDTRILVLPEGHDPDSYVMREGPEAFTAKAEKAESVMQFLLQLAIDTHGLSVEGRIHILDEMKVHLSELKDRALRSLHVRELAEKLNIDEKAVLEKVREQAMRHKAGPTLLEKQQEPVEELASDRREKQIISMMLNYPDIIDEIKKKDTLTYFYSDTLRRIAEKIINVDSREGVFITNVMANMKTDEEQQMIASFAMKEDACDVKEDLHQTAVQMINRIIRVKTRQDNTLTGKIVSAEKGSDPDVMELLRQKQSQIRQLHDR